METQRAFERGGKFGQVDVNVNEGALATAALEPANRIVNIGKKLLASFKREASGLHTRIDALEREVGSIDARQQNNRA